VKEIAPEGENTATLLTWLGTQQCTGGNFVGAIIDDRLAGGIDIKFDFKQFRTPNGRALLSGSGDIGIKHAVIAQFADFHATPPLILE
jgi:hypothetical protein